MRYEMYSASEGRKSLIQKEHFPHLGEAQQFYGLTSVEAEILAFARHRPDIAASFAAHQVAWEQLPAGSTQRLVHLGAMQGLALALVCLLPVPTALDALSIKALHACYLARTSRPLVVDTEFISVVEEGIYPPSVTHGSSN